MLKKRKINRAYKITGRAKYFSVCPYALLYDVMGADRKTEKF